MSEEQIRQYLEALRASQPTPLSRAEVMMIGGALDHDVYEVGPEGTPYLWVVGEAEAEFFGAAPVMVQELLRIIDGLRNA